MPTSTFKGPIILTQSQFDSLQSGGLLETGREYLISDAEPEVGLTPTITIEASQVLDTDPALAIQFTADQLALLSNDGYGTFMIDMTASSLGKYCWVKQNKTTTTLVIYRVEDLTVHKINITLATGQGVESSMTYSFTATWGNIAGTLSDQTDLATALAGKQATLTAGDNITITNNVISAEVPEMEAPKGGDAFIPVVLNQDGNRYNGLQQIATLDTENSAIASVFIDYCNRDVLFSNYSGYENKAVNIAEVYYTNDGSESDAYIKKYYLPTGESAGWVSLQNIPSDIPSANRKAYDILGKTTVTDLGIISINGYAPTHSVVMIPGSGATYPRIVKVTADNSNISIGVTPTYTYYELPSGLDVFHGGSWSTVDWSKFMKLGDSWYSYCTSYNDVLIANEDFTEFTKGSVIGNFNGFSTASNSGKPYSLHQLYATDGKKIVLSTGLPGGKLYVSEDGINFTEKQVSSSTSGESSIVTYVEYLEDQDYFIFSVGRILYYTKDFNTYYWVRSLSSGATGTNQESILYVDYNASQTKYTSLKKYLGRGLFAVWGANTSSTPSGYITTLYLDKDIMFATAPTSFPVSIQDYYNPYPGAALCGEYICIPTAYGVRSIPIKGIAIQSSDPVSIEAADDNIIVTQPVNSDDPITIGLDSVIVLAESNEGTNYDRSTSISTGYNTSTGTIIDSEITMTGREGTVAEGTTYYTNIRQGQQYVILKEEKPDGEGNQVTDMLYVQGGNTNFSREVKDSNGDRVSYDTYDLQQVCEAALNGGGGSGSSLQADGTTIIDNDGTISTAVGGYTETIDNSYEDYLRSPEYMIWNENDAYEYTADDNQFDYFRLVYEKFPLDETINLVFDSGPSGILEATGEITTYAFSDTDESQSQIVISNISIPSLNCEDGVFTVTSVYGTATYTFSSQTLGQLIYNEESLTDANILLPYQVTDIQTIVHPINSEYIDLSQSADNETIKFEDGKLKTVIGGGIQIVDEEQYQHLEYQDPMGNSYYPWYSSVNKYAVLIYPGMDATVHEALEKFQTIMGFQNASVGDTISFTIQGWASDEVVTNWEPNGTLEYFSLDTPDESGNLILIDNIEDPNNGFTLESYRFRQREQNGEILWQIEINNNGNQVVLDPEGEAIVMDGLGFIMAGDGMVHVHTEQTVPVGAQYIPIDNETLAVDGENIKVNIDGQTLSTDGGTLHTAIGGGVIPGQTSMWSSDFVEWDENSAYIRDFGGDSTTIDLLINMITEAEYQVGDTIPLRFNLVEYGDFFCEGVLDTFTDDQVIIDTITCQDLSLTDGVYTITLDSNNGNVDESFESALIGQFEIDSNPVNAFEVIIEHETPSQTIPIDAQFIPVDNETIVVDNGVLKAATSGSTTETCLLSANATGNQSFTYTFNNPHSTYIIQYVQYISSGGAYYALTGTEAASVISVDAYNTLATIGNVSVGFNSNARLITTCTDTEIAFTYYINNVNDKIIITAI